jgi:hypothetical protein
MVKVTSQCPAQATPVGPTFRTEVSLDEKVMGTARFVPLLVCAEELKKSMPPNTREVLPEGERVTLPGKSGVFFFPAPQPAMLTNARIATARRSLAEPNLPMHPSLRLS